MGRLLIDTQNNTRTGMAWAAMTAIFSSFTFTLLKPIWLVVPGVVCNYRSANGQCVDLIT